MSHQQPPKAKHQNAYRRPAMVHKGKLSQFAGSPLGRPGLDSLGFPK